MLVFTSSAASAELLGQCFYLSFISRASPANRLRQDFAFVSSDFKNTSPQESEIKTEIELGTGTGSENKTGNRPVKNTDMEEVAPRSRKFLTVEIQYLISIFLCMI